MRVARFEVNKKPPYIVGDRLYAPIMVQPTWFGELILEAKTYFFLQNEEEGLGLPEYTEELITNLWDNHVSGEIFEVPGNEAYSELYMYMYNKLERRAAI